MKQVTSYCKTIQPAVFEFLLDSQIQPSNLIILVTSLFLEL